MKPETQYQLTTILLEENQTYSLSGKELPEGFEREDGIWEGEVIHMALDDCREPQPEDRYGRLKGIHRIWKEIKTPYICVNVGNALARVKQEDLESLRKGKIGMILPRIFCNGGLQEDYRGQYYVSDFRLMLSVLEKESPRCYKFVKEKQLGSAALLLFGGIFRKEEFDRICQWIFPILARCGRHIPAHFSLRQNRSLEQLSPYLFTFFVNYWRGEHPYAAESLQLLQPGDTGVSASDPENPGRENTKEALPEASREEVLNYVGKLMDERNPEEISRLLQTVWHGRQDLADLHMLFERYERERRCYEKTVLDTEADWRRLLKQPMEEQSVSIKSGKPRLLIYEWASIGHKINVQAFENFGFECECFRFPNDDLSKKFDEDCLEMLNQYLDKHAFDAMFSLNFRGTVAEACYIHGIPYIAWCYDSPTFTGEKWYHFYSTTHIFCFDSDDARHYREAGIKQAYHMPLGVGLDYWDSVVCTQADKEKYGAEISFIGNLYESSLPKAMGSLPDHQKNYLNALIDSQRDVYGYNFFPEIVNRDFTVWLNNPEFNKILNEEFDKKKATEDILSAGRLLLILNKQTTNKERMLLINLLAKHFDMKLYSNTKNPALQGMTFCGVVDYYTQMPKVFKCSKINLNATLRSIQNGMPLRCLDVMACGGTLLTNYQKDFDEHFSDQKNLLFYTDSQEALEKADYYLRHDAEREKIARSGYETVKKYYNYPVKIREILETAGLQYLIPKKMQGEVL